ncbi:hypothetical protein CLF_103951 [Clonorchis sinensis]|uniref:Reverse transcriptase domain-containing protein n=1 Tax=Clonorchis sinensis TaxID=79923 RepID=G7YAQ0_CLOSI|nr:hypothetical protein CLF_103951 [Clonorchis sinensis]
MPLVLAKLRETGRVLVWQSEEGHYSHMCFSRWQQIALFRRFPDVVNVDGTHATNRFGKYAQLTSFFGFLDFSFVLQAARCICNTPVGNAKQHRLMGERTNTTQLPFTYSFNAFSNAVKYIRFNHLTRFFLASEQMLFECARFLARAQLTNQNAGLWMERMPLKTVDCRFKVECAPNIHRGDCHSRRRREEVRKRPTCYGKLRMFKASTRRQMLEQCNTYNRFDMLVFLDFEGAFASVDFETPDRQGMPRRFLNVMRSVTECTWGSTKAFVRKVIRAEKLPQVANVLDNAYRYEHDGTALTVRLSHDV